MVIIRKKNSILFGVPTFGKHYVSLTLLEQGSSGIVFYDRGDAEAVLRRAANGRDFEVITVVIAQ